MESSNEKFSACQFPPYTSSYPPFWTSPSHPFYSPVINPSLSSNNSNDNNWHYPPYPPPPPYVYPCYHPDYDSQNFYNNFYPFLPPFYPGLNYPGSCYQFQPQKINNQIKTPNIIITSSSDDEKQTNLNENDSNTNLKDENDNHIENISSKQKYLIGYETNRKHKSKSLESSTKKLIEKSNPADLDLNLSKDDKKYVGEYIKEIQNSEDDGNNVPSPIGTEKSSEIENCSDVTETTDSDEDTQTSSEDSSSEKQTQKTTVEIKGADGLKAIKSVADIRVYDECLDEVENKSEIPKNYRKLSEIIFGKDENNTEGDDDRDHISIDDESSISSCSVCLNQEIDYDSEEKEFSRHYNSEEDFTENSEEIVEQEMLSVIYEESERDDKDRGPSQASTIISGSDCSTTIANDEDNDSDIELKIQKPDEDINVKNNEDDDDLDENSSLVTVRLPLKVSFSRSSNDENITTVIVGDSEIEDERSIASTTTTVSKSEDKDDKNEADISVTISLPSRRGSSFDGNRSNRNSFISIKDDDSDSEVSFSLSLPRKRENNDSNVSYVLSLEPQSNIAEKNNELQKTKEIQNEFLLNSELIYPYKNERRFHKKTKDFLKRAYSVQTEDEAEEIEDEAVDQEETEGKIGKESSKQHSNIQKKEAEDESKLCSEEKLKSEEDQSNEYFTKIRKNSLTKSCENAYAFKRWSWPKDYNKNELPFEYKEKNNPILQECNKKNDNSTKEKIRERENEKEGNVIKANEDEKTKKGYENVLKISDHLNFSSLDESAMRILHTKDSENSIEISEEEREVKVSVRDRIAAFEATVEVNENRRKSMDLLEVLNKKVLNRNNSLQKSESEIEEDDSGVTSDLSKIISETDDTEESESFPELRKMSRYQRAATHSRLFKLLQEESNLNENDKKDENQKNNVEEDKEESGKNLFIPKQRKKIIHNVSITRRQNPNAIKDAETMSERRERLSLPLKTSSSIDADNLSTSNSPSSPSNSTSPLISDKLVNELIQSLLLKKQGCNLRNLSMEKLQAAARKALQESFDSLENTSLDSTPALTPQEFKTAVNKSNTEVTSQHDYTNYYDSWNTENTEIEFTDFDILPSKAFRTLQEQSVTGKRKSWAARCPRVLSSKLINSDLSKVTETIEIDSSTSSSPPSHATRASSLTPQSENICSNVEFKRGSSLSRFSK